MREKVFLLVVLIILVSVQYLQAQHRQPVLKQIKAKTKVLQLEQRAAKMSKIAKANYTKALSLAKNQNWPINYQTMNGATVFLVGLDEQGRPLYYTSDNLIAAASVKASSLWTGGGLGLSLDGSGVAVGIWDSGEVLTTHTDLAGRVTWFDDVSPGLTTHATHVCGTMIGDGTGDPMAKGMAPGASVDAFTYVDGEDVAEMSLFGAGGGLLSNHSYGVAAGWSKSSSGDYFWNGDETVSDFESHYFGYYSAKAADFDVTAKDAPFYLIVKSAGNNRTVDAPPGGTEHTVLPSMVLSTDVRSIDCPDGYDCITTFGCAKNVLTVGAVEDIPGGYSGTASVVMTDFSSWGPTDDGRIKPDIVANGYEVTSTDITGGYTSLSGTSMSTPSVTGTLALLQEYYMATHSEFMLSSTLKALVIHTADEAGPAEGPDYTFGWGLLNAEAAAAVIAEDELMPSTIMEGGLATGESFSFDIFPDASGPITATLVWTDEPGVPSAASLDDPTPKLVNDLDMTITSPDMTTFFPYKMSPSSPSSAATKGDNSLDNVEKIYIPTTASCGKYTLTIGHKGVLTGGAQSFSVIISGNAPPDLAVDAHLAAVIDVTPDCSPVLEPTIILHNVGAMDLTSAIITYTYNSDPELSEPWSGLIANECEDAFTLPPYPLTPGTGQTLTITITDPNGVMDDDPSNNSMTGTFDYVPPVPGTPLYALPFTEGFSGSFPPSDWTLTNPDGGTTWLALTQDCIANGLSAQMPNFGYAAPGEEDLLTTPIIDLTSEPHPILTFDIAYAAISAAISDTFKLKISDDCGVTEEVLFTKSGLELATVPTYTGSIPFTPSSCDTPLVWRRERLDLMDYAGRYLTLGFSNTNGGGNNLWIDNISVAASPALPVELISFDGQHIEGQGNLLRWESLTEDQHAYFALERSFDGRQFDAITHIAGQGTTSERHSYQYLDTKTTFGAHYYRLKQVDEEGSVTYSKVIVVDISLREKSLDWRSYPNPTSDWLTIALNSFSEQGAILKAYDVLGKNVLEQKVVLKLGRQEIPIDMSEWKAGLYHMVLQLRGNDPIIMKVVKAD